MNNLKLSMFNVQEMKEQSAGWGWGRIIDIGNNFWGVNTPPYNSSGGATFRQTGERYENGVRILTGTTTHTTRT